MENFNKSMAEVKILIEGYAKKTENGWLASSTVTLVRSNDKNIIVDPGVTGRDYWPS